MTTAHIVRRAAACCALGAALAATTAAGQGGRTRLLEGSEEAEKLVVRLTAPTSEGAGVIFHVDQHHAYGITAKHVVFQRGKVVDGLEAEFRAWPGKRFPIDAKELKLHHQEDLAVFRADLRSLGFSPAELQRGIPLDMRGASEELDPGDALSAVGHSTAGAWITPKEPVRFARGDGSAFLFELSCPRGHSGGGVFDNEWRLVGMMIDEERPYCRALRIEPILKIVQGWKLDIGLRQRPSREVDRQLAKEITVAVVGFDNRSSQELPDLGSVAQDVTTSFLHTVPGVVLVTRDRLDKVLAEHKLPGAVKAPEGVTRLGNQLQADALLTGSVLRYDVERRTFEGFGTSALQDVFRMEISLQLLDVATGRVRFSQTFPIERTKQYPKATSAPRQPIDLKSELLRALLDDAQNDIKSALEQVAAGLGTAGQFIAVPVTSKPAGADVIVNGTYIGGTPTTLKLTLGQEPDVQIMLAGHEPWKRRVKVQPGMTIDVSLLPSHR